MELQTFQNFSIEMKIILYFLSMPLDILKEKISPWWLHECCAPILKKK